MKSKKKFAIGVLCFTLVFMGIVYATFSTAINLTGTATANGSFDVKITNVELSDKSTGVTDNTPAPTANYAVTEQTLSATFSEPGEYIIWDITVTNRGTVDASITVDTEPQVDFASNIFKMKCNAREGTVLTANGGNSTFQCQINFDEYYRLESIENIQTANMHVVVNAVQSSGYEAPELEEVPEFLVNNDGMLLFYTGDDTDVVVPDEVNGITITSIGPMAFANVGAIGYQWLDENGKIKVYPFVEKTAELRQLIDQYDVELVSLDEIYDYVYKDEHEGNGPATPSGSYSSTVETVDLSNMTHLTKIYHYAFGNCSLQSVVFPTNGVLTTIEHDAFFENNLSGTLSIPSTVQVIGDEAFYGNSIETIYLGNQLTKIGSSAFYMDDSTTLKDVYLDISSSQWNSINKGGTIFNGSPALHFSYQILPSNPTS